MKKTILMTSAMVLVMNLSTSLAADCPSGYIIGVSTRNCIEASGVCGENCTYIIDETGKMTISGSGEMYDYNIGYNEETNELFNADPNGNPSPSYKYMYDLTSVVFAEDSNITRIGDFTFLDDDHLTDIQFPNTLLSIGDGALAWTNLSSLTIPDSVEEIGSMIFEETIPAEINCVGSEEKCAAIKQMLIDGSAIDSSIFKVIKPSSSCPVGTFSVAGECLPRRYTPAELSKVVGESNTILLYYK